MSTSNAVKIYKSAIRSFQKSLGTNLYAAIAVGSVAAKQSRPKWSDVDLLIVVTKLNLASKQKIAGTTMALERQHGLHFGINVMTIAEFKKPYCPTLALEGKTLQALLDLHKHPERLLYSRSSKVKFYVPSREEVRKYSLINVGMFLLHHRKMLTTLTPKLNRNQLKQLVAREMRTAFNLTKLAVQYYSRKSEQGKTEIVISATEVFPGFDFSTIQRSINFIETWDNELPTHILMNLAEALDDYIEIFSHYVFKKTSCR